MCVYVCMYVCMYLHACLIIRLLSASFYINCIVAHVYMRVPTCVYIYTRVISIIHVCIYLYTHTCRHTYTHLHACIHSAVHEYMQRSRQEAASCVDGIEFEFAAYISLQVWSLGVFIFDCRVCVRCRAWFGCHRHRFSWILWDALKDVVVFARSRGQT